MNKLAYAALVNKFLFLNVDSNKFNVYRGPQKSPTFLSAITLLLFFITPKAAHNRHEKQHNPKRKGKNIHKHTKYKTRSTYISPDTSFLADRTNGRAIGTLLRPSSIVVVVFCDVMYCG